MLKKQGSHFMLKRGLLTILFTLALCRFASAQQDLCPDGVPSDKLICLIPQSIGVSESLTVGTTAGGGGLTVGHTPFALSSLGNSLKSLSSSAAEESALLPLASPPSGIVFTWDPAAKILVPSEGSLGPVLADRAETIGKHKVFLGISYQHFSFIRFDGISLKQLPETILQADDSVDVPGRTCSINGDNTGACGFIRDVIATNTRIDVKSDEFTTFITYGLTDRIDVSAAIPIVNIRMDASTTATLVENGHERPAYSFPVVAGVCGATDPSSGILTVPCLSSSSSGSRSVSGIGDITLRVKGTAWQSDHAGLALGVDIRTPTGDPLNFLGAGAAGVSPFVIWSFRGRISPHFLASFAVNGSSVIAGDISVGSKAKLPGQFKYVSGADFRVTKWLTTAVDMIGQQVFEAGRASIATVNTPGECLDTSGGCSLAAGFGPSVARPTIAASTGSFNTTSASIGLKAKPFDANLIITANTLFSLTNAGLRSQVVPLLGVSFMF
jgi:hypothetical protein